MASVKFCSKCDVCGARSAEYTEWPACRDCGLHLCPKCAVPGSEREEDRETEGGEDGPAVSYEVTTALCADCAPHHPDPRGWEPERERDDRDDGRSGFGHPRDWRDER